MCIQTVVLLTTLAGVVKVALEIYKVRLQLELARLELQGRGRRRM